MKPDFFPGCGTSGTFAFGRIGELVTTVTCGFACGLVAALAEIEVWCFTGCAGFFTATFFIPGLRVDLRDAFAAALEATFLLETDFLIDFLLVFAFVVA